MERRQRAGRYWLITLLILCDLIAIVQAQQPFVRSSDIAFTIRTDYKRYETGGEITVRYTITNVSNGAIYLGNRAARRTFSLESPRRNRELDGFATKLLQQHTGSRKKSGLPMRASRSFGSPGL